MKKLISLLLCMVLLAAVPALAAQGDLIITRSDDGQGVLGEGIRSSCGMGDSLYMILDGMTRRWWRRRRASRSRSPMRFRSARIRRTP